jgi:diguanylate cyclase (GGDEF)-like protein/PAS domain S-box-containing protein
VILVGADLVSVLLVEDDEDDFLITRDMLEQQDRGSYSVEWCASYEGALAAIGDERHDVYLIDYRLGMRTGLELVREAFASRSLAPVIMLTGQSDYQIDLEASALGVADFMLKQELNPHSLERSIRYAVNHQDALRSLAASEERYALAACAVNDGIWDWDLETNQIYYSPRWHALLGRADAQDYGTPDTWFELVHEEDLPGLRLAIEAHFSGRTTLLQSKHRMLHTDGEWRWMLSRGMAVRDAQGHPTRIAGSLSDITVSRLTERQLQHDALHDSLTGLPNRALFMDRLERAILRLRRDHSTSCAVLFLDIDRFKLINDSFSHSVGDRLLIALAGRIAGELRPGDTVARIAGDEFTILIDDIESAEVEQAATNVANRVHAALGHPFNIDGHHLFVTASTGISVPQMSISPADMVRNADIAMYEAKRRGRDRLAVFDESMHRRVSERLARQNALREIIEDSLIEVHYQPVVDLANGDIHGFEALARWPEGWPAVPTPEFISIAEETGLISTLGLDVLRKALSTLAKWRSMRLIGSDVRMSVNVSARQLDEPNFPEDVLKVLSECGVPGTVLRLEITEGTLMREPERMSRVVSEVCATGVGLELDDFGTGYSSLAALHNFPVNALKIDQSFVAALAVPLPVGTSFPAPTSTDGWGSAPSDPAESLGATMDDGGAIIRSIVALGHALGLQVVAEGIERVDQLDRLRGLGCEFGQGFVFSKPQPAPAIEELLRSWSPSLLSQSW